MKRFSRLLLALALAVPLIGSVAQADNNIVEIRVPVGFEQLTVSSTSKALTSTVYDPGDGDGQADLAVISVETDALRYRVDGVAPTATVGMPQAANSTFTVYGILCIKKIRMIRVTTDSTIEVHYYRVGSK